MIVRDRASTRPQVIRSPALRSQIVSSLLLTRSGSVCIYARNLQKLMIEIYKSIIHLSPSLVWEFHETKCKEYNLRTKTLCKLPTIRSTNFGMESVSFRGSFLWNTLDDSIKNELF